MSETTVKKRGLGFKGWAICILVVVGLGFGAYGYIFFSDGKAARMLAGATMANVDTEKYTIEAAGTNPRVYEWVDKHGRHCTTIVTNESGMAMDCDFKPTGAQLGVHKVAKPEG